MAKLGATTYTAVTWTTGDVITEAKLDNMVANDQAYDSHTAQGLLLDNDKGLAGTSASATAFDTIYINTDNELVFGHYPSGSAKRDETCTYASATSFTVSGDVTTVFKKGTKIRYKQGGSYEYGYVESSSYGAPN